MSDNISANSITGSTAGDIAETLAGYTASTAVYEAMLGILPKAQLFVPKAFSQMEANDMTMLNDSMALKTLNIQKTAVAKKFTGADNSYKAKMIQSAGAIPVVSTMVAARTSVAATTTALAANDYSVLEAQYNPKSISISASGGGLLRRPNAGDASLSQMQITSNVSRSIFSVELMFEDINIADAFHLEGLDMNAESILKTIASMAVNSIGSGYSVQAKCDGLLALLNFKRLKQVVFLWSNMFFHGELTSVDVKYSMFNKLGNPILATVRLTIEQNDSNNAIRYAVDDDMWNTALNIAFKDYSLADELVE